jgi:iron complex transport system ATP-binding protein
MKTVLKANQLSFYYQAGRVIFLDVDLEVNAGEILTILGMNGAGKSTLLNCVAGLLKPARGEIILNGRNQKDMTFQDVAKVIGYVPQINNPAYAYSVLEFVVMGRTPYIGAFSTPKNMDYQIAEKALARMGILPLAPKPYTEISGGERQLATIARAIAQEAQLIMLDEPTAHLDFGNQMKTVKVIKSLAEEGYAVVMTTHVPDHPIYLGSRVALFEAGFVSVGRVEELITEKRLSDLYGIPLKLIRTEEVARPVCVAI